jgi:hypothetical protein
MTNLTWMSSLSYPVDSIASRTAVSSVTARTRSVFHNPRDSPVTTLPKSQPHRTLRIMNSFRIASFPAYSRHHSFRGGELRSSILVLVLEASLVLVASRIRVLRVPCPIAFSPRDFQDSSDNDISVHSGSPFEIRQLSQADHNCFSLAVGCGPTPVEQSESPAGAEFSAALGDDEDRSWVPDGGCDKAP